MQFLHKDLNLSRGDRVLVNLDRQANVLLLDHNNYHAYRAGHSYRYQGGLATTSPVQLVAPHSGHWHVVIDLGGYSGTVHASINVMPNS